MKPDFTDKWKKQRNFYKKAVINDKGDTWPYLVQDVREIAYENWIKDITDPSTGECYKGRVNKYIPDGKGGETVQIQELEPREEVMAIIRIRTDDNEEYLLTKRNFIAYNQFGNETRFYMPYKEMYEEPDFKWRTDLDHNTGKLKRITDGPQGGIKHYLVPFTPEAIDELLKLKWKKPVQLILKEDLTGEGKVCPTLDMFKTKSFEYIMRMEYLTPEQRVSELNKFEAEQGDKPLRKKA